MTEYLCADLCTDFQWQRFYPLKSKVNAHLALDQLHQDVGVFHTNIPDNAMEMVEGEFKRMALRAGRAIKPVEVYTHNQNLAESSIRDLCRMFQKAMRTTYAGHVTGPPFSQKYASAISWDSVQIAFLIGT
jgi:hypothetical protein